MISRIIAALAAVICSGLIAYAQFQSGLSGIGEPGGKNALVQFNTNGVFGGITGLTSDGVGVSFGTSSQLILYGFTVGNCLKVGTNNEIADSGGACGGGPGTSTSIAAGTNITTSGTATNVTVNAVPSGNHEQIQFNTNGAFSADNGFIYKGSGNVKIAGGTFTSTTSKAFEITGTFGDAAIKFDGPFQMDIATGSSAADSLLMNLKASGTSVFWVDQDGEIKARFNTAKFNNELKVGGVILSNTTGSSNLIATATGTFSTGNCAQWGATGDLKDSGSATCGGITSSSTNIAAGTNITTSGTTANVTVNLVATPSITTLIASGNLTAGSAQFTGATTGTTAQFQTYTGSTASLTGNLTGTTAQLSGALTGTTAQFQTYAGATANLTSNLTGTTAQFSSLVTGTTANFQTATVGWLSSTNYFNWAGEGRTTADSQGFISTGVINLISLPVNAGRTYKIEANAPVRTAAAATGGIAFRLGGTATATAIVYQGWLVDSGFNGNKGSTQATALSSTVANATLSGTTGYALLFGTITVNAGGTLILQAAGFTTVTAASAATVGRGATLILTDIP